MQINNYLNIQQTIFQMAMTTVLSADVHTAILNRRMTLIQIPSSNKLFKLSPAISLVIRRHG